MRVTFPGLPGSFAFQCRDGAWLHRVLDAILARPVAGSGAPDLATFHLDDDASVAQSVPGPAVRRRASGKLAIAAPGVVAEVDADARHATIRYTRAGYVGVDSVLRQVVVRALAVHGLVMFHAAAIELDGRVQLVFGPRRSGKSTLAMSVLAAGGRVASDDSVLVSLANAGGFRVSGFRRDFMLRHGGLGVLPPDLRPAAVRTRDLAGETRWCLARDAAPGRLPADLARIDGLVFLAPGEFPARSQVGACVRAEAAARLFAAASPLYFDAAFARERRLGLQLVDHMLNQGTLVSLVPGRDLLHDLRALPQ